MSVNCEVAEASPWFITGGGLNIPDWEQVKADLQKVLRKKGTDNVPLATFSIWCLVKDALLTDKVTVKEQLPEAEQSFEEIQEEEVRKSVSATDTQSEDEEESQFETKTKKVKVKEFSFSSSSESDSEEEERPPKDALTHKQQDTILRTQHPHYQDIGLVSEKEIRRIEPAMKCEQDFNCTKGIKSLHFSKVQQYHVSQGNMLPPEPRHPTTSRPEHYNAVKSQENDLKGSKMKIIEVLREEIKNSLKEIKEKTIEQLEEINKSVKECEESQMQNKPKQVKETIHDMKIKIEAIE
ncbi:hypothetical protein STEG23_014635 [Scotinomys teguina]